MWYMQESLQPMQLGESGKVRIGQQVLAIGNPFGFDHTLTTGLRFAPLLTRRCPPTLDGCGGGWVGGWVGPVHTMCC